MTDDFTRITERIWDAAAGTAHAAAGTAHAAAGGAPGAASRPAGPGNLTVSGPRQVLPSVFDVTGLAVASVAAATLAAAEFHAARNGTPPSQVTVDSRAACAAFAGEALFTPVGWTLPDIWDPIAGNYQAQDGWIRLHTNYAYHRAAVERVLSAGERESVRAAVGDWKAEELEAAVVAAGGCAAAMHARQDWLASPQAAATATAPLLEVTALAGGSSAGGATGGGVAAPYAGIRVLDLTRVIAGPVGTRFLAAYGADVLRVDPPGFAEVPACLPETTAGKHTTFLGLRTPAGRSAFERLVATADVLVTGLRADALGKLGYDEATLRTLNPALILVSHNAYGWSGPWRDRRGFDSLVQMSCGIAEAGARAAGSDKPVPLPVQALDHATGYLLAAAVGRALTRRLTGAGTSSVRASLIGTANLLWSLPRPEGMPPPASPADFPLEDASTAWGPARRVPLPGQIAGTSPRWTVDAGPLGRHGPAWAQG
jgi:CoA-transferase family III